MSDERMSLSVRASLKAEIARLRSERDALASELLAERETLERARELLRRVEPDAIPCHDGAERLRTKFGLDPSPAGQLVEDIRAFLAEKSEGST